MGSIACNLLIFLLAAGAVAAHARHSSLRKVLCYFTAQSNVLCAAAALAVAAMRLNGAVPAALLVFKFVATVAVLVTLLTVLFFHVLESDTLYIVLMTLVLVLVCGGSALLLNRCGDKTYPGIE